jgi:uncharacterized membrane protein
VEFARFTAAIARFFHPLPILAAASWVILILARRVSFSRSLRLIADSGRSQHP